jgi:hypothetical protein
VAFDHGIGIEIRSVGLKCLGIDNVNHGMTHGPDEQTVGSKHPVYLCEAAIKIVHVPEGVG